MTQGAGPGRLRLRLLQERSGGTFARVYVAEATGQGGLTRLVAVKLLREQWNEADEFVARTQDEARMLARLRHPNIVKVEELTQIEGQLAIVMEFVDGIDLKQLVERLKQRGERIPPRAVFQIVAMVASALDAAYRKTPYGHDKPIAVVHRDIKPSNVMVTPDGEVKVLDFGTARGSFDDRSAHTSMMRFGSLKYMSPERREGDRGQHVGDIYSLGLMLMELLESDWLGLAPEPPEHDPFVAHAAGAMSDTGMAVEDWDAAVRKVICQMCAADPEQRPTGEQVTKLLRAFADRAEGNSLEAFCAETVVEVVSHTFQAVERADSLVGTELSIDAGSEAPPALAPPSPALERPRPPAEDPPRRARRGRRAASPAPEEQLEGPSRLPRPDASPVSLGRAPPAPPTPQAAAPQASPGRAPRRPPRAPPSPPGGPTPRVEAQPTQEASSPPSRKGLWIALAAGGLALMMVLGLGGLGLTWWWYSQLAPEPAPLVVQAEGEVPPPPPLVGTPVLVRVQGDTVQWVRLLQADDKVAQGKPDEPIETELPSGVYTLSVKLVGHSAASSTLDLGTAALELDCAPDRELRVSCVNPRDPSEVYRLVAD
jgi:serine/threonine protein kinase